MREHPLSKRISPEVPENSHLAEWMAEGAHLEVDLGCGKGLFLTDLAQQFPAIKFLGVERQRERVMKCRKKIHKLQLENTEAIRSDCEEALAEVFPNSSVDCFYILFPDPWPKKRHHRRRMVNTEFLAKIHTLLKTGGMLRLMTDDEHYFCAMHDLCEAAPGFEFCDWDQGREFPTTDFQKLFLELGRPIHRVAMRKL
ncbi:MAG: tRNA (guanosine(46)-N7)-methyltransferase TrmB [Chthoniobacterales bacterium]